MIFSISPAPPELPADMDSKPPPLSIADDSSFMGMLTTEVHHFREALGLSSLGGSVALNELLMETLENLKNKYPKYSSSIQITEVNQESLHQGLLHFNQVLKSIRESWSGTYNHSTNFSVLEVDLKTLSVHQLAERALEILKYMVSQSKEIFDHMDMASSNVSIADNLQSKPLSLGSPHAPTSVLPETPMDHLKPDSNFGSVSSILRPARVQAFGKSHPLTENLSFHFNMFPLVLDHSLHLIPQKDQSFDDLMATPTLMNIELKQPALTDTVHHIDEISWLSEPTSLGSASRTPKLCLTKPVPGYALESPPPTPHTELQMPSITHFQRLNIDSFSQPSNINDVNDNVRNSSSEATIFSVPVFQLGASRSQSLSPSPPASPIVLAGVFMPFSSSGNAQVCMAQPFPRALSISDFGNDNGQKPSESTLVEHHELVLHPKLPLAKLEFPPHQILHLQPIPEGSVPPPPPPPTSLPHKVYAPPVPAPPPPTPRGSMSFTPLHPPPPPPLLLPSSPGASVQITSPQQPQPPSVIAPTQPPPPPPLKGSASSPTFPVQGGQAPPPPPPVMRLLRAKVTKLKRSSQMGSLYRLLKSKLEGSNLPGKVSNRKKNQGTSKGEKGRGMADALAEMTKRSSYFQHIEDDVQKYSASILEIKSGISNFHTKDITELLKFHQNMEKHLEELTDETQVLARFEGFPFKKLESIRMAVALYMKLDGIVTTLKTWKTASPVAKQLDKIESYFTKIKEEVDAIERTKDEEFKRFRSNDIEFDFAVLTRIKEVMVDLSSNCIEMAIKESQEVMQGAGNAKLKSKHNPSKLLWRAFQLAFRVYNFAGGQDERADRLACELAREIEMYS